MSWVLWLDWNPTRQEQYNLISIIGIVYLENKLAKACTSCSLADTCKYQDSYLSNLAPVWAMTSGLYSVLNDHHAGFAPYHFAFHIAVYTESTEKLTEACQAW